MNIYIDSTNGNDAADSNLYKTLDYVLDYIATLSDSEFNIYLKNGNYGMKQHNNLFTKTNIIVNIIGTGPNVILEQTQPFYFNSDGGGVETFNLNVNKLVYNISNINHNYNCFKFIWNFNNVVFNKIPDEFYGVFLPANTKSKINHCIKVNNSKSFIRTTGGTITVSNSYGGFTSGYSTTQDKWDDGSNIIIDTPQLDDKFIILDVNNDIYGVYSGDYAWKSKKYLIMKNNQYYSVKDKTIVELGIPADGLQKQEWFKDYGVYTLKESLLTPDENGNKLIDSLDDKFEVRMMVPKG